MYVAGLPGLEDLVDSLRQMERRVGAEWRTASHRETYVMARKVMQAKFDLREASPESYVAALSIKEKK